MIKHGRTGTKEHIAWVNMRARCTNPNRKQWPQYGGRGIVVHPEFDTFEKFFKYIGKCPNPSMSLDRIDVNGDYEPGNIRWATPRTQKLNRTDTRHITFEGDTRTLKEWSEFAGISLATLWKRLNDGWDFSAAIHTPKLSHKEGGIRGANSRWGK
jgi:hypothetical protein